MVNKPKQHAIWGHRGTFVLAATGSAVGLGNIWKFPYITGENGGGAFVLMYLVFIALIGIPIMIAEVLLGRRGRANPINAVAQVSEETGASKAWNGIGWCAVLAGFLILSYYSVIAGWTLEYVTSALQGEFAGLDGASSTQAFETLLADKNRLIGWQTLFIGLTVLVVAFGVTKGLETAVRLLMPLLFALLLVLLGYAVVAGEFAAGAEFLFGFNFRDLSWEAASIALGHAFFTLSLAMGAIMAYGSYMPSKSSIGSMVLTVAVLDTLVALIAGMAIFPIVFATPGISPGEGAGLMFVSLPIAFGTMPMGVVFGALFFLLITLAAWSSTISLLEPAVAYLTERFGIKRLSANLLIGASAWFVGLGTVLSFNDWEGVKLVGKFNFFGLVDFVTTNLMLPLGGLLMAIFVGWVVRRDILRNELGQESERFFNLWYWVLRYISPMALLVVLLAGLRPLFD